MADGTTTNYGFTKPELGASYGTWDDKWNDNADAIDAEIKAREDEAAAAQTDATTALANAATAQAAAVAAQSTANSAVSDAATAQAAADAAQADVDTLTPLVGSHNFGSGVTGAQVLDLTSYRFFNGSVAAAGATFTFSNVPSVAEVYIEAFLSGLAAFTGVHFPTDGRSLGSAVIGKINQFRLVTCDGGTTWFGELMATT